VYQQVVVVVEVEQVVFHLAQLLLQAVLPFLLLLERVVLAV
jgi:hypothetical protein